MKTKQLKCFLLISQMDFENILGGLQEGPRSIRPLRPIEGAHKQYPRGKNRKDMGPGRGPNKKAASEEKKQGQR